MTKKKLMMAGLSAGLVAVVGVGGTLAYLSAQSNTVENSFTVGSGFITDDDEHTGLYLDEMEYVYQNEKNTPTGERTEIGNDYQNLYPGNSFTKDPTVKMVNGSVESYVFVKVEGVDTLEGIKEGEGSEKSVFDIAEWNTNWVKLNVDGVEVGGEGDGYYVYKGTTASTGNGIVDVSTEAEGHTALEPVFGKIIVNNVNKLPENSTIVDKNTVKVKACAVQATDNGQGVAEAFKQAKGELDQ